MHVFEKQACFRRQQIEPVLKEIDEFTFSIAVKEESIKALAGALLQIAKQGISTVHGKLNNCVDGRTIKNEPIKNIVWQGRNQSMHYEEGKFFQPIIDCFHNIEIQLRKENLAKEIVDLLG